MEKLTLVKTRLRGRSDGRRGLPTIENGKAADLPYEETLKHVAEHDMHGIEVGYTKVKDKKKGRASTRKKKKVHADDNVTRRVDELEKIEEPDREARLAWFASHSWPHVLALATIVLLDAPMMVAAAAVVMPDSDISAIAIGIVVGAIVAWTGHLVGANLRRIVEGKGKWTNTLFAGFFGVLGLGLQIGAAVLRAHAAAQLSGHATGNAVLVTLAAMGLGVFGISIWLSYERSSTAARAVRAWRRGTRRVEQARRKAEHAETRFTKAMSKYKRAHERAGAHAGRVVAALGQHTFEYRRSVERARKKGSIPFADPPQVSIPHELVVFDDDGLRDDVTALTVPLGLLPAATVGTNGGRAS